MRECMNCGGDVNADGGCWCAQVAYWQARAGEWGEQGDKLRAENVQLRSILTDLVESARGDRIVLHFLLKNLERHEAILAGRGPK